MKGGIRVPTGIQACQCRGDAQIQGGELVVEAIQPCQSSVLANIKFGQLVRIAKQHCQCSEILNSRQVSDVTAWTIYESVILNFVNSCLGNRLCGCVIIRALDG